MATNSQSKHFDAALSKLVRGTESIADLLQKPTSKNTKAEEVKETKYGGPPAKKKLTAEGKEESSADLKRQLAELQKQLGSVDANPAGSDTE